MKWYSTKKYDPPIGIELVCFRKDKKIIICEHDGSGWIDRDFSSSHPLFITHFCILSPIEIEE